MIHRKQSHLLFIVIGMSLCLITACARSKHPEPRPPSPEQITELLAAPSSIDHDFIWEQTIVARFGDQESSFSAVLQHQGDSLLLLGLTPYASRAFSCRQSDHDIDCQWYIDPVFEFPLQRMLADIHFAYFIGLDAISREMGLFRIEDQWTRELLLRRKVRFQDSDFMDIQYINGYDGQKPPAEVKLQHLVYGYSLTVRTTKVRELQTSPDS